MDESVDTGEATGIEAQLRPYLSRQAEVVAAYLFGSRAKGTATAESDIDIALLLACNFGLDAQPLYRLEKMTELADQLSTRAAVSPPASVDEPVAATSRRVDVVLLNQAPLVLQHQVLKYGKLIYEADRRQRVDFEVRSMQAYLDWKPTLDRMNAATLQRIKEGRLGDGYRGDRDPLEDARRLRARFAANAELDSGGVS